MTSVRANSGLGRWFREKWVDISRPKEGGGFEPCGRSDTSKGRYPKCVPAATAARMSPEEIKSAIRRKRRAESSRERDGKAPIMVSTFKDGRPTKRARTFKRNKPTDPQLYAKVKAEARRRFDVYPSAYANGWLVQEYKRRGGKYLRASAAPDSTVLVCTSTVVLACKSKACAPPPVGTGGSKSSGGSGRKPKARPAGGGTASTAAEALTKSHDAVRSIDDDDIRMTLVDYGNHGHEIINEPLRKFGGPSMGSGRITKQMDKGFDKASVRLTAPITVHRGLLLDPAQMGTLSPADAIKKLYAPGSSIVDHGFMSTSSDPNVAAQFADQAPWYEASGAVAVRMRITVPKGARVLAGRREEAELILNRGTKMNVIGASVGDNGVIEVTMEVVG